MIPIVASATENANSIHTENGSQTNRNVHRDPVLTLRSHSSDLAGADGIRDGDVHGGSTEVDFAHGAELCPAGNHCAVGVVQRDFRPHHPRSCEGEPLWRVL